MPRVIDIQRRHMELGRIRLGQKGAKGQPQRLDTWRLTSASKALLDSAAGIYGGATVEWSDASDKGYYQLTTDSDVLDVMVPPGDAYSQYYEMWSGGGCKRRCDGVTELLSGAPCKCDPDERECKITTRINVMLPKVAGLGVWRLESHGYYAAAELPDMLELLQQVSGGRLVAGVLRIEQRSAKKDGRTNRFPVPVLDLPNITLASLTGGQVVVNPPQLEAGKPALTGNTGLPDDPAFDNGSPGFGARAALPTSEPTDGELRDRIAIAARERFRDGYAAAMSRIADKVGVPHGERATSDQLRAILELIEQPSGVPAAAADGEVGAAPASPPETPQAAGDVRSDAATVQSEALPSSPAAPAPTMDDVLAVTGGEEIPPKPGTDAYKALPPEERAKARAYHAKPQHRDVQPEPQVLGLGEGEA